MPESPSRQYLNAARALYADASKILTDRPYAERGSASSEAALLLARAQAAATLSIAGMLADGVRLHMDTEAAMEDFGEDLGRFTAAIQRLTDRLDDSG